MSYPISRCRFPNDVLKIISLASSHGIAASVIEAEKAWEEASDDACAGWLGVNAFSDEEIWDRLPSWFKGEEEDDDTND